MMLVTAIVEPFALAGVRSGLDLLDVAGMTVSDVSGRDPGSRRAGGAPARVRVEVVVEEGAVADVVDTVVAAARTGTVEGGRIWVTPIDTAVRVRTGERGADAL